MFIIAICKKQQKISITFEISVTFNNHYLLHSLAFFFFLFSLAAGILPSVYIVVIRFV